MPPTGRSIEDLALARARGYTCSSLDPIGGGAHCLLGGGATDFLVTSTLASQVNFGVNFHPRSPNSLLRRRPLSDAHWAASLHTC